MIRVSDHGCDLTSSYLTRSHFSTNRFTIIYYSIEYIHWQSSHPHHHPAKRRPTNSLEQYLTKLSLSHLDSCILLGYNRSSKGRIPKCHRYGVGSYFSRDYTHPSINNLGSFGIIAVTCHLSLHRLRRIGINTTVVSFVKET